MDTEASIEPESPTFEETYGQLQKAIEQLEHGGLSLEAALELFEQSMDLAASCHRILDRAELRLTRLVEEHASTLGSDDQG